MGYGALNLGVMARDYVGRSVVDLNIGLKLLILKRPTAAIE